jgi:hypothetical protein
VRAFAHAGRRRRVDVVSLLLQQAADTLPAPAPSPAE